MADQVRGPHALNVLILKRRRGEVITIGEAYVQVLQISEEWVELGITAPPEWAIDNKRGQANRHQLKDGTNSASSETRTRPEPHLELHDQNLG